MKHTAFAGPNSTECLWGLGYLIFQLAALPALLNAVNGWLPRQLTAAELNFTFFLLNFLAAVILMHRFLGQSLGQAVHHPLLLAEAVILGTVAYYAASAALGWGLEKLQPGFSNVNDAALVSLSRGSWYLMTAGTVVLAPVAEECFYRGILFRRLYDRAPWIGFTVSMALFALVHVLGYVGKASALTLVLCFVQYLPAGFCLAWSYVRGQTVIAPILIHAIINARSVQALF